MAILPTRIVRKADPATDASRSARTTSAAAPVDDDDVGQPGGVSERMSRDRNVSARSQMRSAALGRPIRDGRASRENDRPNHADIIT